ncbi:MAG: hypothetical protein ACF8GE_04200 [Phycisphaerales bacterium JB043]
MIARMMICVMVVWGLAGCASRRPAPPEPAPVSVTTIEAGGYARAFESTRDVFRQHGFTLDRIDARAGVIETLPAPSSQLRPLFKSFGDHLRRVSESLAHRHRRVGEARFVAVGATPGQDLTRWDGPMRLEISVRVERLHRFDTRVEPVSIRLSSVSSHTLGDARDDSLAVSTVKNDEYLSSHLVDRIVRSMATSEK